MKQTTKSNYRVIVEPRRLGDLGSVRVPDHFGGFSQAQIERDYQQRCEEIAAEIERHVGNVAWAGVVYDTEHTCSHCGSSWEDNPECCNAAIAEWDPQPEGGEA